MIFLGKKEIKLSRNLKQRSKYTIIKEKNKYISKIKKHIKLKIYIWINYITILLFIILKFEIIFKKKFEDFI